MLFSNIVWNNVFPIFPLILYVILALLTVNRQKQVISDKRHTVLDGRMNANLTLVGFAFAVIGLLISLFQSDLSTVFKTINLFSVSLASFFGSYVLLHFRLFRIFDTMSEGLTNNGLWSVMAGLWLLFNSFEELKPAAYLFLILLISIVLYVIIDILFKWRNRNQLN